MRFWRVRFGAQIVKVPQTPENARRAFVRGRLDGDKVTEIATEILNHEFNSRTNQAGKRK